MSRENFAESLTSLVGCKLCPFVGPTRVPDVERHHLAQDLTTIGQRHRFDDGLDGAVEDFLERGIACQSLHALKHAVFDPALVRRFLDGYADTYGEELTAPVFCGVQVVTTDGMVFGDVPEWITADLEKGRDAADVALEVLGTFVDAGFRSIYLVPPILRAGRRDYAAATRVLKGFRP